MNSANDDRFLAREAYLVERERRRKLNENRIVRMDWAPPKRKESPIGMAILACVGLLLGCIVGAML